MTETEEETFVNYAWNGYYDVVSEMLVDGMSVHTVSPEINNDNILTATLGNIDNNWYDLAVLAIELGIDVNHKNDNGDTALSLAIFWEFDAVDEEMRNNMHDVIKLLLERGADTRTMVPGEGRTIAEKMLASPVHRELFLAFRDGRYI